jgi:hypothetical protein
MRVLDPGGLLLVRDYVGPNRWQFTDAQLNLSTSLWALLPARLRQAAPLGELGGKLFAPRLADMLRLFPHQAVRSEDIEKMIYWRWRVLEEIPLGGTLAAPLFAALGAELLTAPAAPDSEAWSRAVTTLMEVEMRLITGKLLPSDYKAFICRPL